MPSKETDYQTASRPSTNPTGYPQPPVNGFTAWILADRLEAGPAPGEGGGCLLRSGTEGLLHNNA